MQTSCRLASLLTFAAVCAAALTIGPAQALPVGADGLRAPAAATGALQQAACWRDGWHGWGWYAYCGPPPPWAWEPACSDVTVREHRGPDTVVRHIHRCY
jgi:hypothetical protein